MLKKQVIKIRYVGESNYIYILNLLSIMLIYGA